MFLIAILATGCGGGGGDAPHSSCSLTNPAGCGGSLQPDQPAKPTPPPDPAAKVHALGLVFSANELKSAGLPGTEVTVTVLLKTAENVAVSGAAVEFAADSGLLAVTRGVSDASGKASAVLSIGTSKQNRPIKVSARSGRQSAAAVIHVTGTHLAFTAPSYLTLGSSSSLVATLHDSADRPIAGEALTASVRNGNVVTLGAAATDHRGQVPVRIDASVRGSEQITLSALGASVTRWLTVGGGEVVLLPAVTVSSSGAEVLPEVTVGACSPVDGSSTAGGTSVLLSASRGTLFTDAACSMPVSGALTMSGSNFPRTYIQSDHAGPTTIAAAVGSASGTTRLEFVAPLVASSWISLQSSSAVLGSGERSTLVAVVRDGTIANNLVKGAAVQFSIVADPSGGNLLAPFTVDTGSDGAARAVFVAGPADGGKNGTRIEAHIVALTTASDVTELTVNKKALSIQFGTGNTLVELSPAVVQQDFAVFVADSAGNPVQDVTISAAAWPTSYRKGFHEWERDTPEAQEPGRWKQVAIACANEDIARKGLYESAFDVNGNGTLEPGIPLSVSASGKTDAVGMTTVSLRYPRDRARWVEVELTVTGAVAGTESVARNTFWLHGMAKDYSDPKVSPPGMLSPYGQGATCDIAD